MFESVSNSLTRADHQMELARNLHVNRLARVDLTQHEQTERQYYSAVLRHWVHALGKRAGIRDRLFLVLRLVW